MVAESWRVMKQSFRDPAYRDGLKEALRGLRWVLATREPVPSEIDNQVRIAEKVFYAYDPLL